DIKDLSIDHNLHEVIYRNERRLVYDIDYIYECINPWKMIEDIILKTIEVVNEYYYKSVDVSDFIIFESNGLNDKSQQKYSYHIILETLYFSSKENTEFIYNQVLEGCVEYVDYMDFVYKPNQNIRLYGSKKIGSDRVKKLLTKYVIDDKYIHKDYSES